MSRIVELNTATQLNRCFTMSRFILSIFVSSLLSLTPLPVRGADVDLKADLAKMQGKWKGTLVNSEDSFWTLEIKGNKSKLAVKNKAGDELVRAEFDFKLEQQGKFRAFTYWNVKHLAGEQAGQTELAEGKTRSSVYKFDGSEAFSTVGGFDEEDKPPHWLLRWEKQ